MRSPTTIIPAGWFYLGESAGLAAGEIRPIRRFGRDLILWRGEDGEAHLQEAYCPHLGAHIGVGGKVVGDTVQCPFHHWSFDGCGALANIPYAKKQNVRARLETLPTSERQGNIMGWYHPQGAAPSFELPIVPELDDPAYVGPLNETHHVRAHIQEMSENAVDSAHFETIHQHPGAAEFEAVTCDGPVMVVRTSQVYPSSKGPVPGSLETISHGCGFGIVHYRTVIDVCMLVLNAPIDLEHTEIVFQVSYRNPDRRSSDRSHRPRIQGRGQPPADGGRPDLGEQDLQATPDPVRRGRPDPALPPLDVAILRAGAGRMNGIADPFSARGRTLGQVLRDRAEQFPDRVWLMSDDRRLTFADVNQRANDYAAGLAGLGVGRGDRVAIFMHGAAEFVILALAINKLGAIWVPVNTDYRGEWLRNTLNRGRPSLIVTDAASAAILAAEAPGLTCRRFVIAREAGAGSPALPWLARLSDFEGIGGGEPDVGALDPRETAAILWTSGTTGAPKGVMQSHSVWLRAPEISNAVMRTTADDVGYCCLPFYNSGAWGGTVFRTLSAGIPCAIDTHFSVSGFWDRLRFYGGTQTMTLGAMHIFLWNAPPRPDDADNPLRVAAMVPFPERLITPFCERFGLEAITQGFGQSEIMVMLTRRCEPGAPMVPNALGEVAPTMAVRLADEEGREVAPGEVGEFTVQPHEQDVIFNGYFDDPEATAHAFRNGWYHTGDLGRRDADGNFFFVDRQKDYIRYKGRSVSSFEIESVVSRHPAVAACAAFGIPSSELESEHEIKVDVVLKPAETLAPEDLAAFVNANAPYFFVPRYIEFRDALPLTPTNKIEKYKLRADGVGSNSWDRVASGFEVQRG